MATLCPLPPLLAVTRTGVFNVQTLSGNVMANNIAATHYGQPAWTAAPRLATVWYHAVDAVSSVVGAQDASHPEAKAVTTSKNAAGLRSLVEKMLAAVEGKASSTNPSLRG
jgi:hypothetical protein